MRHYWWFGLLLCAVLLSAQSTTSRLDGTVNDPQGAVVPGAEIIVLNVNTGQSFTTTSDARGQWVIPAVPVAVYKVTVTKPGFRSKAVEDVTINAGVPATVNITLEVGTVTESVVVSAGVELLQASTAAVSNTIIGRQINQLPYASRNSVELLVSQPGTQTPTTPRSSSINGLPKGALNITIDGLNTQDNTLKSSDGFFSYIYPSQDAVEEITLTTSASGADSTGQGAAQIKFVTKSGSNAFHGGTFWQHRNTALNANYYFNNQSGLSRDSIKLNQGGFHIGGPIKKNKAFFFTNYEIYRLPATQSFNRTILTDTARAGIFTYTDTVSRQIRTVDLYQLAAAGNARLPANVRPFATTPDPILADTYAQIAKLSAGGILRSNVPTNNDYNRQTLSYQPAGNQKRYFWTTRLDYNLTSKHMLSFIYNYDKYDSIPDFLNSVVPIYPGTGTVLGTDIKTGQSSNRFAGTLSLRSVLTTRLTNEWRGGVNGGTVLFRPELASASIFSPWKGYIPTFASANSFSLAGVTPTSTSSRRNAPVTEFSDTVSWVKGRHQISVGGSFDQVNFWQQSISTSVMPRIAFGIASADPISTGTTGIFNAANFPNSSTTDQTNAGALYAALTGRVNTITRSLGLDEKTHKYSPSSLIDRNRMREYGLFINDTWKIFPTLTVNFGLRYERQLPFENLNNTYTRVGLDGLWGLSGVGNLFAPGVLTGVAPTYKPIDSAPDAYKIPAVWAPSVGIAWQLPAKEGALGWLLGTRRGASVLRMGYGIATVREGQSVFTSIWGSNQGLSVDASLSNASFPADFGAAGSVWFRDPSFPSRSGLPTQPVYPIVPAFTNSLNEFDPNLKMGYVQSWNIGWQRELGQNTVMELRYTGNHGTKLWRQYNLNEVNIFENGFLNEFKVAANNLAIARTRTATSNNFGNQGFAGQLAVPILQTALGGSTTDATIASNLTLGLAGTVANAIATNATRMGNLTRAGYAANLFMANPTVGGGGAFLLTNGGSSSYNAFQVEVRRRLSKGFLAQGSYAWSKSLANGATASTTDFSQPTTLRNAALDRGPSGFDIRHGIKLNWIYELPVGSGRRFGSSFTNPVVRRALEGWQLAGIVRLQSGTPFYLGVNNFFTFNQNAPGVVLHNLTGAQLQDMIQIRKTTGADGKGIVYYLPDNVIRNTQAAFNTGGLTPAQVDPTQPYIGPAAPGSLGWRGLFYLPWQRHFDLSVIKVTKIKEQANVELRVQFLNAFNMTNFLPNNNVGSSFGQVTSAYRDINGTVNPGSRIIEFVLRFTF